MEVIEYNDRFFIGESTDRIEADTQAEKFNPGRRNPEADYGEIYLAKHCTGPYATRKEADAALGDRTMKTYTVSRYNDGKAIGTANLTDEQFRHYEAMAQQPEGLIRLGALPHSYYDLHPEYQDAHEDTTVYID